MNYKVHRAEVKADNLQEKIEEYLNNLNCEVISTIHNVRPTFQFMGTTVKVDYLLIVKRRK